MAKYVYKKVSGGRGRPTKYVQLDDGTLVPYKEYEAQNGKLPDSEVLNLESTEKQNEPIKSVIFNRERLTKFGTNVVDFVEDGVQYSTKYGSPLKILAFLDSGSGFQSVLANVEKRDATYRNILLIDDIQPTPNIPVVAEEV